MSAASRSGSGEERTSANVVRNPSASVSGKVIFGRAVPGPDGASRQVLLKEPSPRLKEPSPRFLASQTKAGSRGSFSPPKLLRSSVAKPSQSQRRFTVEAVHGGFSSATSRQRETPPRRASAGGVPSPNVMGMKGPPEVTPPGSPVFRFRRFRARRGRSPQERRSRALALVGLLSGTQRDDREISALFGRGLRTPAISKAANLAIKYRSADGHFDRLSAMGRRSRGRPIVAIIALALPAAVSPKLQPQQSRSFSRPAPIRSSSVSFPVSTLPATMSRA